MPTPPIHPIILAAGPSRGFATPKALARFGGRTALDIALDNVAALAPAVVVLGSQAAEVRSAIPPGVHFVINKDWRRGQLASLLAGLAEIPRAADFMLYPVDYPLLTPALIGRLVEGFAARSDAQVIALPTFRGRGGHPVIFSARIRRELEQAATAREVVYREPARVKRVAVRSEAIWQDLDTPAAYRERLRAFNAKHDLRRRTASGSSR